MNIRLKDEFTSMQTKSNYSVRIHSDSSGSPRSSIATLTNPSALPTGGNEAAQFTASGGGIDLAASTTYFVVLDVSNVGTGTFAIQARSNAAEDTRVVSLSERVTAWGLARHGTDEFALTEEGGEPIETDLTITLGTIGGRGTLVPAPEGRGFALALSPTVGAAASGAEQLWSATDARGLAPGTEFEAGCRLEAEVRYGLLGPFRLGTVAPCAGLGFADEGARWQVAPEASLDLEGTRSASAGAEPERGVMVRGSVRW